MGKEGQGADRDKNAQEEVLSGFQKFTKEGESRLSAPSPFDRASRGEEESNQTKGGDLERVETNCQKRKTGRVEGGEI